MDMAQWPGRAGGCQAPWEEGQVSSQELVSLVPGLALARLQAPSWSTALVWSFLGVPSRRWRVWTQSRPPPLVPRALQWQNISLCNFWSLTWYHRFGL